MALGILLAVVVCLVAFGVYWVTPPLLPYMTTPDYTFEERVLIRLWIAIISSLDFLVCSSHWAFPL